MEPNKYKYINLEFIYEMADGENEFVIEIISNYLNSIPGNIQKLQAAVEQKNNADIVFYGHKLKGSFRFMGAIELGDLVERMEKNAEKNSGAEEMPQLFASMKTLATHTQKELEEVLANISG